MKKFYSKVSVVKGKSGFAIKLDDKVVKTPAKKNLNVNSDALANSIASEWREQGEKIDIKSMPHTTMCYAAIDQDKKSREMIAFEVAAYADTDLICYRAEIPLELHEKEAQSWDPIVAWLKAEYGVELLVTKGISHVEQAKETNLFINKYLAKQDNFVLIALHMLTGLLGSVFLSFAVAEKKFSLDEAWLASRVDEDFQASRWGDDQEAKEAIDEKYKQYSHAVSFLCLSQSENL